MRIVLKLSADMKIGEEDAIEVVVRRDCEEDAEVSVIEFGRQNTFRGVYLGRLEQ